MKRKIIFILLFIASLFVVYNFILRTTGVLVIYNNPTTANSPNIKLGSKTLVTNLINSSNGDFICYKFNDEYLGEHIRVHRQIAKFGDTIRIENGIVYVNNKNIDKKINLTFSYKSTLNFAKKIDSIYRKEGKVLNVNYLSDNNYLIYLNDSFIIKNNLKEIIRNTDSIGYLDPIINGLYNQNWNKDNFGPLVIPENKIFVLGDNRDDTFDSRTIGLISLDDVVGVVLKVF